MTGQWERALNQLDVAAELDAEHARDGADVPRGPRCELLRAEVFAGKRSPMIFGEPEQWLALLIESLLAGGPDGQREQTASSASVRSRPRPRPPATIDGDAFDWIADADMRLGPVCEAIVNGRYYWIPFARLTRLDIEAPADLRDVVWTPAHFQFTNGGEAVGLIPTRYPGSEARRRALRLAPQDGVGGGRHRGLPGLGQRVLATDGGEYPLLDVRSIVFEASEPGAEPASDG